VGAFTSSQKIVVVPEDIDLDSVGHELIHTLPFLWSEPEMQSQCRRNYHNKFNTQKDGRPNFHMYAHGYQITLDGNEFRTLRDPAVSIMGPVTPFAKWMDQCTYWHLVHQLSEEIPDPPVILIQGRLARKKARVIGELFSSYPMDGIPEVENSDEGAYAVILRDASGTELGRFPFGTRWKIEDSKIKRSLLPFSLVVPDLPGVSQIDLVGPNGLLFTRTYSENPPAVVIDAPDDGATAIPAGGTVEVAWTASDPDGDPLLSTVLYSSDGGTSFTAQSFEQSGMSFDVAVASDTTEHVVKVIVTDGARSAEAVVGFTTA
jgi:hypothetical protein